MSSETPRSKHLSELGSVIDQGFPQCNEIFFGTSNLGARRSDLLGHSSCTVVGLRASDTQTICVTWDSF